LYYISQKSGSKGINNMRKISLVSLWMIIFLLLTACETKPTCPPTPETERHIVWSEIEKLSSPATGISRPEKVKINGKITQVDKVVTGPLCNDHWNGTVYVACNVQVLEWKENPLFLKDCDLNIEPDTVVYVAYHNDAAYYNGCSCHTGQIAEP
jgi:hypothetical protein